MRPIFSLAVATCLLLASSGQPGAQPAPPPQGGHQPGAHGAPPAALQINKAIAVLVPAAGSPVQGTVTFERTPTGVKVIADISGLTPGKHGFHVHEFGDLSAADFTSAGPHFMAPGEPHGAPGDAKSHRGDLGNLEADATGKAHLEYLSAHLQLSGPGGILGRAVVVHEQEDDLSTQPTGNSGARIACGVIGLAKG
jgi:superoxide dismutase, Cu-Zn family